MSPQLHAALADRLIQANGGVRCSAAILALADVERSEGALSKYASAGYRETMPAMVIHILERACGDPIYSRAMMDAITPPPVGEVLKEACEAAEATAALQHHVRIVSESGKPPSLRVIDELADEAHAAVREARGAEAAVERLRRA